jgi:hypothetical protein
MGDAAVVFDPNVMHTDAAINAALKDPLVVLCVALGLSAEGNVPDLKTRLKEHYAVQRAAAPPPPPPPPQPQPEQPPLVARPTIDQLVTEKHVDDGLAGAMRDCDDPSAVVDVVVGIVVYKRGLDRFVLANAGTVLTMKRVATLSFPTAVAGANDAFLLLNTATGTERRAQASQVVLYARRAAKLALDAVVDEDLFRESFDELADVCIAERVPSCLMSATMVGPSSPLQAPPVIQVNMPSDDRATKKDITAEEWARQYRFQRLRVQKEVAIEDQHIGLASFAKGCRGLAAAVRSSSDDPRYALAQAVGMKQADGTANPDEGGDGLVLSSGGEGVLGAELSSEKVKKRSAEYTTEPLAASHLREVISMNTAFVVCYGSTQMVPDGVAMKEVATFGRRSREDYLNALRALLDAPKMSGNLFRHAVRVSEVARVKIVNEIPSQTIGDAYTAAAEQLRLAVERQQERNVSEQGRDGAPRDRDPPRPAPARAPASGENAGGGGKDGEKGKRLRAGKLPRMRGGVGSNRPECGRDAHNPDKKGQVMAWCQDSHVHWKGPEVPAAEYDALKGNKKKKQ